MDTEKFACNKCGGKIRVDREMCGDTIECPHCSNSIMVPLSGIKAGMAIGEYVPIKRLGVGAMGEVWLAKDSSRGRNIALKILSPALTKNHMFVKRFQREVSIAAKMSHPNIVTAFDAGVDKNIYYLAINYVKGENLEKVLRRTGHLSEKDALAIALAIAQALQYATEKHGLVHRDIKPGNIMIDDKGIPLLMDLGVSKQAGSQDAMLTTVGQFVGTPHYMSPEQARAEPDIDFSSDIYSLGCTLYHMLAGRPPFKAESNVEILNKHIHENPRPAQYSNPEISNSCAALLEIMLAKKNEDRQSSWTDVITDINAVIQGDFPITPCKTNTRFYAMQNAVKSRPKNPADQILNQNGNSSAEEGDDFFEQRVGYFLAGVVFSIILLTCIWLLTRL